MKFETNRHFGLLSKYLPEPGWVIPVLDTVGTPQARAREVNLFILGMRSWCTVVQLLFFLLLSFSQRP